MVCLRRMDLRLTREGTAGKLFISVAELELIDIDSSGGARNRISSGCILGWSSVEIGYVGR
jgi:hypothetical protein